jgi:hypothetical protein
MARATTTRKVLTKADILKGAREAETVFIEELGGEVSIRPLTDSEWHHSRAILMETIIATAELSELQKLIQENRAKGNDETNLLQGMNLQLDVGKLDAADYEASVYIATCGLSTGKETWTAEEVGKMKPGLVEKIAKKVQEISGVTGQMDELVKSFRQK